MLTPADVAKALNISYDTALHMIKYSGIPYVKVGRQYRVCEKVFYDLLSSDDSIEISFGDAC